MHVHGPNLPRRLPAPAVMPKPIYGHGQRSKKGSAPAAEPQDSWLILAVLHEDLRHQRVAHAVRDTMSMLEAGMVESFAACFVEYSLSSEATCAEEWSTLALEVCEELSVAPGEGDECEAFVSALRRQCVLTSDPPPPPPLQCDDTVLAVLKEDGEWHQATALSVSATQVLVRFSEWGKTQDTPRSEVVALAAAVDDDEETTTGHGACEMCSRELPLTFHHLVPKEVHSRFVGKAPPPGLPKEATPTKEYFNSYGLMLCRPCHSHVHRFAPNLLLAQRYNSLPSLLAQQPIQKWVAWASKQGTSCRHC